MTKIICWLLGHKWTYINQLLIYNWGTGVYVYCLKCHELPTKEKYKSINNKRYLGFYQSPNQ